MKQEQQPVSEISGAVREDENAVCDICGRFGAYQLGDRKLCAECYTGCGSCCPEFGNDDVADQPCTVVFPDR